MANKFHLEKKKIFVTGSSGFLGNNLVSTLKKRGYKVYALNKKIPASIPPDSLIYVLEMNNDQNKIMGIGLTRNKRDTHQRIRIYRDNPYYNRYIYHSNQRIDAKDVKHQKLLKVLESMVFKGSRHMKRGQGITCIPWNRFKKGKTRKIIRLFFQSMF